MADTPSYAATLNISTGTAPATLDTSLTAPSNVTTVFTAAASGSRVEEITFQGLGTTAAGVINLFLVRSAAYKLIDQVLVTAVTSSTTAVAFRTSRQYANLLLETGDTLAITTTVSTNQAMIQATCYGADF